jgi:hypothetical protein
MVFFSKKKWPRLILVSYLAVAIVGISVYITLESLPGAAAESKKSSDAFIEQTEYLSDFLAKGAVLTNRTNGCSCFSLRNEYSRILVAFGAKNFSPLLSVSSLKPVEKSPCLDIKDTILLKLRT